MPLMKKLFFVALAFLSLLTIAPQAEARDYHHHSGYSGYSRHHHGGYYPSYGGRLYRSSYYSHRPVVYYRTAPVYYSSYYDDGYCAPRYYSRSRYYSSRPRFSFFFGF